MGAPCTCRTADGVELRGTVAGGEGPGVLLIHGLASNARMWDGVIAVLEEQGRAVAAFDMRGHGQSEQAADGYTIDQLATDVAAIIAQLSADDPIWQAPIVAAAEAAGRDPQAIGIEGRITWTGDLDQVKIEAEQWRALDATHVSINTMGSNLSPISAHLEVLTTVASALELR